MKDCIFCKIATGKMNAHIVWEDREHVAFLSIYPNTLGFTVVIPRKHEQSYAFASDDETLVKLLLASKKVAIVLDNYFDDVGRTGMMFEGFGVNHLHAKLFPMHGTKLDGWKQIKSKNDKYFDAYEGYISSHDGTLANDSDLSKLAGDIRKSYKKKT